MSTSSMYEPGTWRPCVCRTGNRRHTWAFPGVMPWAPWPYLGTQNPEEPLWGAGHDLQVSIYKIFFAWGPGSAQALEQMVLWAVSFQWPYTWVLGKESQREYCGGDELCSVKELGQEPSLEAWVMQCPRMAWAHLYFESSPESLPEYLRPCSCAASDTPLWWPQASAAPTWLVGQDQ